MFFFFLNPSSRAFGDSNTFLAFIDARGRLVECVVINDTGKKLQLTLKPSIVEAVKRGEPFKGTSKLPKKTFASENIPIFSLFFSVPTPTPGSVLVGYVSNVDDKACFVDLPWYAFFVSLRLTSSLVDGPRASSSPTSEKNSLAIHRNFSPSENS